MGGSGGGGYVASNPEPYSPPGDIRPKDIEGNPIGPVTEALPKQDANAAQTAFENKKQRDISSKRALEAGAGATFGRSGTLLTGLLGLSDSNVSTAKKTLLGV